MKTKKAIYEWWLSVGNTPPADDMQAFRQNLKMPCQIENERFIAIGDGTYILTIRNPRWKWALVLYFHGKTRECYKIYGF